jgi:hypothetical protein
LYHHTQISIYPSVEQKESEDDVGDDDDDNVFLPESSDVSEQKIRNQFLQPQRGKLNKKKKKKKKTRNQSYIVCSQNRSLNRKGNGERMMGRSGN